MKELFYYSIFAIILYFVLTQVFDNFNLEQENFDPSLVPVSSIVTLAKVAQKLVNGNGVLTNPGSLQIGTPTVPGKLTVTGETIVNGMLNAPGNITIANSNPFITFAKDGQAARPQLYSDGGTIHVYGGHLKADNDFTVGNTTLKLS